MKITEKILLRYISTRTASTVTLLVSATNKNIKYRYTPPLERPSGYHVTGKNRVDRLIHGSPIELKTRLAVQTVAQCSAPRGTDDRSQHKTT